MTERIHYLYKITNNVNGKIYIGVTVDPDNRKSQHFARCGSRLVNTTVAKYGKDNFAFEVICVGSKEYIYDLEFKAIKLYNSNADTGHGYNLCDGGIVNNQVNKGKTIASRSDDVPVYVSGFWFPNKRTSLKALGWGVGMFNSRKRKGILGDVSFEKKPANQSPEYVTGFWFPSRKVCLDALNLEAETFHKWKRQGTLGDIVHFRTGTVYDAPQYYAGFWFPSLRVASEVFDKDPETIYKSLQRTGVGRWKVNVNGITYESITEASQKTGMSRSKVSDNLNENKEGFTYVYSYETKRGA